MVSGAALSLVLAAGLLSACFSDPQVGGKPLSLPSSSTQAPLTEKDVSARVLEAASRFNVVVASTADAIAQQTSDRRVRRLALLWKVRMTPLVQSASLASESRYALLELYALAVVQRQYLTDGAGKELFGDQQQLARANAEELEADVAGIAKTIVSPEQAHALEPQIEELARANPIRGEFRVESTQNALAEVESSSSTFAWVIRLPLAPFRALEGVHSGAVAMHDLNGTGRQFNEILAHLPEQSRWQVELLLYDVEDRESVTRSLAALDTVVSSVDRLSILAEHLPQSIREQTAALLNETRGTQLKLAGAIASVERSLTQADQLLVHSGPQLETLERTSAHFEAASHAWGGLVRDALDEVRQQPKSAEARPFDVLDYERTAAQIGATAVEIRNTLLELPGHAEAGHWIDWVLGRVLIGFAGWFALLLLYRVAVARLAGDTPHRPRRRLPGGKELPKPR